MSWLVQHWQRLVRGGCLCALACCFAGPALALELAADLSSHYIEIRTTFKGAQITVFGSVNANGESERQRSNASLSGADVIVVVRGPLETLAIRRKARLGPIWANQASLTAKNVPSFYYVASTQPVGKVLGQETLERYHIGFQHLNIDFSETGSAALTALNAKRAAEASATSASSDDLLDIGQKANAPATPPAIPAPLGAASQPPDTAEVGHFRNALFHILKQRRVYSDGGRLTVIRSHLFRTEVDIPSTVPAGAYNADIYLVKDHVVLDAESIPFFIDKKGLERDIYTLAMQHPILHGLLAVFIAVAAGWLSEAALRRR